MGIPMTTDGYFEYVYAVQISGMIDCLSVICCIYYGFVHEQHRGLRHLIAILWKGFYKYCCCCCTLNERSVFNWVHMDTWLQPCRSRSDTDSRLNESVTTFVVPKNASSDPKTALIQN